VITLGNHQAASAAICTPGAEMMDRIFADGAK
jgi:hypothetical protein